MILKRLRNIFILLLFTGCSAEYKKTIATFHDGTVKEEHIFLNKDEKSSYTLIEYYPSGHVAFRGRIEKFKFVDAKISYYENGSLKEIDSIQKPCELNFCCCDGKVLKYYSNGKLNQVFENRNGIANGVIKLYENDSSGTLASEYVYRDGRKNGVSKRYYNTGELYFLGVYRNDTLVDRVYYFEPNGDTMKIYSTWKGKEDFPAKKWLMNGQIFYASYLDTVYRKVLYRWTDKSGKEIKREIINNQGGKWVTPN